MASLKLEARPALRVEEEPRLDGLARPRVRLQLAHVGLGPFVNLIASRQDLASVVALGQRLEVVGVSTAAAVRELNAAALTGVEIPPDFRKQFKKSSTVAQNNADMKS